jgi:penicillin-binding protein 2
MAQASYKTRMLEAFRYRMYFFLIIASFVFLILLIQLINLQVIQGREYAAKSRMNMENNIPIPAARGEIYDRTFQPDKKKIIVTNRPSFNITTIPANFRDDKEFTKTIKRLSRLLKMPNDDIIRDIKEKNQWERALIKEDVDFQTIVTIATHQEKFPNIDWEDASVRVYSNSNMFAHVIGYIGIISKEEYKVLKNTGYKHYQKLGKAGIEKEYDAQMRGVDGYIRRIVDVHKRTEGEEIGLNPVAGNNMILTIDYEVQKAAHEAMANAMGAVIAIKPSTGEIIALVSKPDFDPNEIISKNNYKIVQELYSDKNRPFLNRAIQSKYPPASTFKLVTSVSALEEEKWDPRKNLFCNGKYTLKGFIDKDFYDYRVHGRAYGNFEIRGIFRAR